MTVAFAVFLFRQFTVTLPDELFQAARIDGASELRLWWSIALPLCRPVLATLAIFTVVGNWNAFLWPMLVTNKPQMYTISVGAALLIRQGVYARDGPAYGRQMAMAMIMSLVPLATFALVQRQMIRGLTLGALKG